MLCKIKVEINRKSPEKQKASYLDDSDNNSDHGVIILNQLHAVTENLQTIRIYKVTRLSGFSDKEKFEDEHASIFSTKT